MPDSPLRNRRSRSSQQTFRAGNEFRHAWLPPAGSSHGACKRFEQRFDLVVVRSAVQHAGMHVGPRSPRETLKEVMNEFRLQVSHESNTHFAVDRNRGSSTEVDRSHSQGFIHWHQKVSSPKDALLVAEGFVKRLSQHDSNILDRVMLVDFEVAASPEIQVKP